MKPSSLLALPALLGLSASHEQDSPGRQPVAAESVAEKVTRLDALVDYQFNRHVIHHVFCRTCGVESFARGKGKDGRDVFAINVRCLDGVDIATLSPKPFDGRRL